MESSVLISELQFKAIRSSGAGGQHVNKVSSKIELAFDLQNSNGLSEDERQRLQLKLSSRINKSNQLVLFCEATRSQHRNKEIAIQRFLGLVKKALQKEKPRKATKPTRSSIKKRLEHKQQHSLKKALRKKPRLD